MTDFFEPYEKAWNDLGKAIEKKRLIGDGDLRELIVKHEHRKRQERRVRGAVIAVCCVAVAFGIGAKWIFDDGQKVAPMVAEMTSRDDAGEEKMVAVEEESCVPMTKPGQERTVATWNGLENKAAGEATSTAAGIATNRQRDSLEFMMMQQEAGQEAEKPMICKGPAEELKDDFKAKPTERVRTQRKEQETRNSKIWNSRQSNEWKYDKGVR